MQNKTLFLYKIALSSCLLTVSACSETNNEQNKQSISSVIQLNDSPSNTSINGSIPIAPVADDSSSLVGTESTTDTTDEESSAANTLVDDDNAVSDTSLELSNNENTDLDGQVALGPIASSDVINTSTPSPIAETEFAKPEDNVEEESISAAQRILENLMAEYPVIDYSITEQQEEKVEAFCKKINARLSSVSYKDCLNSKHKLSPFSSVNGEPIVITEFAPTETRNPLGRVLVIGGTHGDELTSVSTSYKWIKNLNRFHSGLFHWHIAPAINPDGVFLRPATRANANGIDINRNLPTPDWTKQSLLRWEKSSKNPRRNPGTEPASEPETQWIMHEIASFKPDAIVSIHAPYGILDFDSPELKTAPSKFGKLKLNLLGTYPGSLGNYAGIEKEIPVLTLELPNAQYMPPQDEMNAIWSDMIAWLKKRLSE